MIKNIKEELQINKKTTSMYIRSKTSAADDRPSSTAIGYVGVLILLIIGGLFVVLDLPNLVLLVKKIKHRNQSKQCPVV